MDELKQLIELVRDLPHVVLWVLIGYLFYKLAIVGSVYSVIRYGLGELFGWLKSRQARPQNIQPMLLGLTMTGSVDVLQSQLLRLCGISMRRHGYEFSHIHNTDVEWLRKAIDAQIERDAASSPH